MTTDHFERLGLPRRFSVDAAAVERAYLARSRDVHPDFHAGGSADDRRAADERAAALNEAYLTVKDPFRRADYLLKLLGGPTATQEKNLDQAFLMEMMDLRERIEEATAAGPAALDAVAADLKAREAAFLARVASTFAPLDSGGPVDAVAVRRLLNAVKTVRSLARDLPAG